MLCGIDFSNGTDYSVLSRFDKKTKQVECIVITEPRMINKNEQQDIIDKLKKKYKVIL